MKSHNPRVTVNGATCRGADVLILRLCTQTSEVRVVDIGASVGVRDGAPCYNNPDDQTIVIDLLEKIDVPNGGVRGDPAWSRPPAKSLRWNSCPAQLLSAIRQFQTVNQATLPYAADGHVDPGGPTIALMNSLAGVTIAGVTIRGGVYPMHVELHDQRILGGALMLSATPGVPRIVKYTTSATPISSVIAELHSLLEANAFIQRLDIVAHGSHIRAQGVTEADDAPLFKVLLGSDGIHGWFYANRDLKDEHDHIVYRGGAAYSENLHVWAPLKGRIREIRFYSCGAASRVHWTARPGAGVETAISGFQMCGQLAVITGAYVIAAEKTQNYDWEGDPNVVDTSYDAPSDGSLPYTRHRPTVFHPWAGPVHVFSPSGGGVVATSTSGADPVYTPISL